MTMLIRVKKFAEKLVWSFIGVLIGFLALGYIEFQEFYATRSQVMIEVTSKTNVLDVRRSMPELVILFQGEDIEKENLNLQFFQIRITNTGFANVLKDSFDDNDLWGIEISNGRIIKLSPVQSESTYLGKNLSLSLDGDRIVRFNEIIFDSGAEFQFDFLVLHDKATTPVIQPIGKIAGIRKLQIKDIAGEDKEGTLIQRAIYGDFPVQAIRLLYYLLISFFILFILIILAVAISLTVDTIRESHRKSRFREIRQNLGDAEEEKLNAIEHVYVEGGKSHVQDLSRLIEDKTKFLHVMDLHQNYGVLNKKIDDEGDDDGLMKDHRESVFNEMQYTLGEKPLSLSALDQLQRAAIVRQGPDSAVDQIFTKLLRRFLSYV